MACLQETKLSAISGAKFRSFCGFHLLNFRALDANGSKGGLITAWNPAIFSCDSCWVGSFSLNLVLRRRVDDRVFSISNVYGPTDPALKDGFLLEVRNIALSVVGVWLLLGDFNLLLSVRDKNGPLARTSEMLSFRATLNALRLLDISLSGRSFTWSNGRSNPILERPDRALVSKDWHLLFPRSSLRALPRPRSDHSPLLLTAFTFVPAPQIFRFEAFWLRYPKARSVITGAWDSSDISGDWALRFSSKLGTVTDKLKEWGAGLSSAISKQVSRCSAWILWLDKAEEVRLLNQGERSLRCKLKVRFDELSLQEELRWKQRSRVNWLRAGDANTKFFHMKACGRRRKNFISSLAFGADLYVDHASIAFHLLFFFRRNLGTASGRRALLDLHLLFGDSGPALTDLDAPFSEAEIKLAVFSLGPDKAPGPDGFPLIFYQRFWNTLKGDLCAFFFQLPLGDS